MINRIFLRSTPTLPVNPYAPEPMVSEQTHRLGIDLEEVLLELASKFRKQSSSTHRFAMLNLGSVTIEPSDEFDFEIDVRWI